MTLRDDLASARPLVWTNPHRTKAAEALAFPDFTVEDLNEAQAKFHRWQPLIAELFQLDSGLILSPLTVLEKSPVSYWSKRIATCLLQAR